MALLRANTGVVLFPGETVEVNGAVNDFHIKGNDFHRAYEEVLALCKPYREKMDSVTHTITAMQAAGTLSPDKLDSLRQLFLPVYEEMKEVKKDFLPPSCRRGYCRLSAGRSWAGSRAICSV